MKYQVSKKKSEYSGRNPVCTFQVEGSPWMEFPVSQEDFDRINVGDTIEMTINILPAEVALPETEKGRVKP